MGHLRSVNEDLNSGFIKTPASVKMLFLPTCLLREPILLIGLVLKEIFRHGTHSSSADNTIPCYVKVFADDENLGCHVNKVCVTGLAIFRRY